MILNYDKDDGVSFIWDKFKKEIPEVSSEANKFFEDLAKIQTINPNIPVDFDGFIKDGNVADESLRNFLKTTDASKISFENYKKYLESAGSGTSKFSSSLKNLGGTLLSTFANMAIMYAAGAAIQFVGTKIYEYVKATEIAIEKGEKAQNAIKEIYDTYNSKVSTVNTLGKQFADDTESIKTTSDAVESLTQKYVELKKGVNADNSNKSLSSNEYQQYLDISNQLTDSIPSLVAGSDSAGNAILNLGTNASDAADKLERLLQTQMAIAHTEIAEESTDTFKGAFAEAESLDKEIADLKVQQTALKQAKDSVTLTRDEIRDALQEGRFDFKNISKFEGEQFEDVLEKYRSVRDIEVSLGKNNDRYNSASYTFRPIVDQDELDAAIDDISNQLKNTTSIDGYLGEIESQIVALETRQQEAWSTFTEGTVRPYLETASQLSDIPVELTNAIENNLQNIDWSSLYTTYGGDAEKMLLSEFVIPLQNLEKPAQEALTKALSLDPYFSITYLSRL